MCGIAGWYRRGGRPAPGEVIAAQCDAIIHRGPDDSGVFIDADLGMGMRRLSIIDIAGGHQPMSAGEGRYWIVYNGEIYNHLDLRPELEARGARFATHSDTETVLAAFTAWGAACWPKFEGMFAAAIFDVKTRTLTLARDPIGIKPLFVSEQAGGIAFASELKALTLVPGFDFNVDERAVYDYFSFGHIQRPRTIWREAREMPPGTTLTIGREGPGASARFWTPRVRAVKTQSQAGWIEEARHELRASVKRHMLSDVPVGSFLSGGVDSAAVTAAMALESGAKVTAFTIGFPGHPIDETEAAGKIATHLGCEHVVRPVDLMKARDVMPTVQRAFDEPSGASAAIPTWYLSKLASEHVKVVLCGEGGDELFAGYKRQRNARRVERWGPFIRALGPVASLIDHLPETSSRRWNYSRQHARRFRRSALLSSGFQRFLAGTEITSPDMRKAIAEPDLVSACERSLDDWEREYFSDPDWRAQPMLQQFMLGDLTLHMPSALLGRLDRASMAHSLEARVPLLSHKFVDWSFTVPIDLKARGPGKYVLREAARPWLPEGALERKKQGFQMPLADWFHGDFGDFAKEAWRESGAAAAGFLRPSAADALFEEHRRGLADHGKLLYAMSMFAGWWREIRLGAARKEAGAPALQTLRAR
jgi:asparagine synthase (glutamine-hydrolysing)